VFLSTNDEQTISRHSICVLFDAAVESFLIDRRAAGLCAYSVKFYRNYLNRFKAFSHSGDGNAVDDITADRLRRYFLQWAEHRSAGGVHGACRTLRSFFHWLLSEELMPPAWKNPMKKIKPPKLPVEPLEPVSLEDIKALIGSCERGTFIGERDLAIFHFLLDTGVRAQELCNVMLADLDLTRGAVMIRFGKSGKTRMAFLRRKTMRAMRATRAYARVRPDGAPNLFLSRFHDRLAYEGLRELLGRRAELAKLTRHPTMHGFRRAFALNMLPSGTDVFSLQRLMGHADLQIMRRYLAQTNDDSAAAQMRAGPVDNGL
jgi:integrase/recombinase XerD